MDNTLTTVDPKSRDAEMEQVWHFSVGSTSPKAYLGFLVEATRDTNGLLHAWVPRLPGCVTQGATESEILENIKDAITAYLEASDWVLPPPRAHQHDIKSDCGILVNRVLIEARGAASKHNG